MPNNALLKIEPFRFEQGRFPVLVSFPHSSTALPPEIHARMTASGRAVPDTDWFLPRLYAFRDTFGFSEIEAQYSRYVIDPNRSTDGENLYPGRPTPLLCPVQCFDGSAIYKPGEAPGAEEIKTRAATYWKPYHAQIQQELHRLHQQHGLAVLLDLHSIRSQVPRLFDGTLPDINVGTNRDASCAPSLTAAIMDTLNAQSVCSHVLNGRFVGGYITRTHGKPDTGIHAVQIELSQVRYLNENTGQWDEGKARETQVVLRQIIKAVVDWVKARMNEQ